MIYELHKAVDRRDNVLALWLVRHDNGANHECAYLGKCPPGPALGRHAAGVKRITFAKPEFYVFTDAAPWWQHSQPETRHLIDTWEAI